MEEVGLVFVVPWCQSSSFILQRGIKYYIVSCVSSDVTYIVQRPVIILVFTNNEWFIENSIKEYKYTLFNYETV